MPDPGIELDPRTHRMTLIEPGWPHARAAAHAAGRPLTAETVSLIDALGRITAEPIRALTALPPHASSAMDGWAVCGDSPWTVTGAVLAGQVGAPLQPGEAVRIATGAAVPAHARGVLRSEDGRLDDGVLHGTVDDEQDVRRAGEEAEAGDVLITANERLSPVHIGLAAAAGHDTAPVMRQGRAHILVVGDELLRSGPARDGRVRDSLGPQLPAWLARLGLQISGIAWVEDTLDAHVRALEATRDADVVVTTGGTAAGPVDYLHTALERTGGRVVVDTVACRPGHPMMLGEWGDRWLVGLPGNPQAAIAALMTLGQPLVAALHGQPLPELDAVRMSEAVKSRGPNTRLVPSAVRSGEATPMPYIGSGMLRGLAAADGFAVIPPGGCAAGDAVPFLPLP